MACSCLWTTQRLCSDYQMSLVKKQRISSDSHTSSFQTDSYSLEGHEGTVLAAKFNNQGDLVASGGLDKKILLWNLPHSSNIESTQTSSEIIGHKSAITSLRWLNGGNLISSSADTTIGLWDTETGERIRKFKSHNLVVNEIDCDSNLIASAGDDGLVFIWDKQSKGNTHSFQTDYPLLTVAFHKNIVYASGIEPVIRAWDIRSSSTTLFEIETLHTDTITSLAVDDSNLISRSQDNTIRLYDPKVIPGNHIKPSVFDGAISGTENLPIRAIIRENLILSGSADKTVTTWDLTSKRLLRKLVGHTGTVIDVDEHHGKVVSSSVDGNVLLRYTNA